MLVLAAALALAGCGGTGGTTTTAPNATTATDAPATTETPDRDDLEYPPGVSEAGLENRTALFVADWTALNESGFVADSWFNQSASGGGSEVAVYRRARVDSGGQNAGLRIQQRASVGTITTDVWQNATVGLTRISETAPDAPSSTRYRLRESVSAFQTNPITSGAPANLIVLGEYDSVSVSGTGADTRITLSADGVNETRASGLQFNVTGYTGELVVDRAGRIRAIDVTLDTGGQGAGTFTLQYDLRETSGGTVARPAWFGTGLAQAPDVNVSAEIVDGSYVALENEGPDPLEAGWQAQIQTRFAPVTGNLSSAVAPGETVYLSIANGSRQLQVTRTVPSDTRPLSGVRAVTVVEVSATTGQTYAVAGDSVGGS